MTASLAARARSVALSVKAEAAPMNAKLNLPNITLTAQGPRFNPSPSLRALGFKGTYLRHPDGSHLSEGQCFDWLHDDLAPRVAAAKEARAARRPYRAAAASGTLGLNPRVCTLAQMFEDLWKRPEFSDTAIADGKLRRRALSSKTVEWYKATALTIARHDPDVWAADAAHLNRRIWKGFIEDVEKKHGLYTARAVRATLSMAYGRMDLKALAGVNPIAGFKLPLPDPRLKVGEIAEMEALIAAADRLNRPEIGDCILLGLMTGQRQADRLALQGGKYQDGEFNFRQSKTGALVLVPATPGLVRRLAAAAVRRQEKKPAWLHVVIDEKANRPFARGGDWYGRLFAEARELAIAGVIDEAAAEAAARQGRNEPVWKVAPCPGLAGFHDQDLRDTAVTWLANAECTVPQICAITGHSEASAYAILKHYLARHPDQARAAIGKLVKYLEAKGARL